MRRIEEEKLSTKKELLQSIGRSIMAGLTALTIPYNKPALRIGVHILIIDMKKKPRPIGSRAAFARSEELRALCRVLRACIRGDRDVPWFKDELRILEAGANQKVSLASEAFSKSGPYFIRIGGSEVRSIVHNISRYTRILASDKRLAPYGPIGVCANCASLFLKTKRSQKYCTTKCRVANWGAEKGKEHFAKKQRERRARKKSKTQNDRKD